MALRITPDCLKCGACEPECPNRAISEGEETFQIDPTKCTECVGSFASSQCSSVCPYQAPQPDPERRESREVLLDRWGELHPGMTPKVFTVGD